MLDVEQCGPSAVLNGVSCTISRIDDRHALLEAVSPDFGFAAFFPGWYGDHSAAPVHVLTVGEHHECMGWLPIEQADKLYIIPRLRISATNKMLCRLSV
jgi:8-oxo-dGTP pyrophosphatase MutT (NUDIX family)